MRTQVGLMMMDGDAHRIRLAEELGFDSVWAGGHIVFHGPVPDPLSHLAVLAAHTTRIRVGTCVLVLPLVHPAIVAKFVSSIDVLSGGRVILGIGAGGEIPKEFEVCGIPLEERGTRTDEGLKVIHKLWTEEEATHNGRHFRFDRIRMAPKPVQTSGPAIWVGGRSEAAVRRAILLGNGYVPYMLTPSQYRERVSAIERLAERAERSLDNFEFGILLFAAVADSRREGAALAAARLSRLYRQPFDTLVEKYCLFGTPDNILSQIAQFEEAGVNHFVLSLIAADHGKEEPISIVKEILPKLQK
jgi:probable F420-dependent oxidoreductase